MHILESCTPGSSKRLSQFQTFPSRDSLFIFLCNVTRQAFQMGGSGTEQDYLKRSRLFKKGRRFSCRTGKHSVDSSSCPTLPHQSLLMVDDFWPRLNLVAAFEIEWRPLQSRFLWPDTTLIDRLRH